MSYTASAHEWGHLLVASLLLPDNIVTGIHANPTATQTILDKNLFANKLSALDNYNQQQDALKKALFYLAGYAVDSRLTPNNEEYNQYGAIEDLAKTWKVLGEANIHLPRVGEFNQSRFDEIIDSSIKGQPSKVRAISQEFLLDPMIQKLLQGTQKALAKIPIETLSLMHDYLTARGSITGAEEVQRVINLFFTPEQLKTLKADLTAVVDVTQRNLQTKEALWNWKITQINAENIVSSTPWFIKLLAKFTKR